MSAFISLRARKGFLAPHRGARRPDPADRGLVPEDWGRPVPQQEAEPWHTEPMSATPPELDIAHIHTSHPSNAEVCGKAVLHYEKKDIFVPESDYLRLELVPLPGNIAKE
jgi:hypothetical protein